MVCKYNLLRKRKKKWIDVETEDLLPGDCISLKYNSEEVNKAIVPCDCLLVEGSAVVNEATLTGNISGRRNKFEGFEGNPSHK